MEELMSNYIERKITDDLSLKVYKYTGNNIVSCIGCNKDSNTDTIYIYDIQKELKDDLNYPFKPFSRVSFAAFCKECGEKIYNVDLNILDGIKCELCGRDNVELFTVEYGSNKIRYCKECSGKVFGGKGKIDESIFGAMPTGREED